MSLFDSIKNFGQDVYNKAKDGAGMIGDQAKSIAGAVNAAVVTAGKVSPELVPSDLAHADIVLQMSGGKVLSYEQKGQFYPVQGGPTLEEFKQQVAKSGNEGPLHTLQRLSYATTNTIHKDGAENTLTMQDGLVRAYNDVTLNPPITLRTFLQRVADGTLASSMQGKTYTIIEKSSPNAKGGPSSDPTKQLPESEPVINPYFERSYTATLEIMFSRMIQMVMAIARNLQQFGITLMQFTKDQLGAKLDTIDRRKEAEIMHANAGIISACAGIAGAAGGLAATAVGYSRAKAARKELEAEKAQVIGNKTDDKKAGNKMSLGIGQEDPSVAKKEQLNKQERSEQLTASQDARRKAKDEADQHDAAKVDRERASIDAGKKQKEVVAGIESDPAAVAPGRSRSNAVVDRAQEANVVDSEPGRSRSNAVVDRAQEANVVDSEPGRSRSNAVVGRPREANVVDSEKAKSGGGLGEVDTDESKGNAVSQKEQDAAAKKKPLSQEARLAQIHAREQLTTLSGKSGGEIVSHVGKIAENVIEVSAAQVRSEADKSQESLKSTDENNARLSHENQGDVSEANRTIKDLDDAVRDMSRDQKIQNERLFQNPM